MERWEYLVMIERFVIEVDYEEGEVYIREMPEFLRQAGEIGCYGEYEIYSYTMPEFSYSEQRIYLQGEDYDSDGEPLYCGRELCDRVVASLKKLCKHKKIPFYVLGQSINLGEI